MYHWQHCVSGFDKETEQLVVGIYEGEGHVRKLSSVKHNYPDHVVKITEVRPFREVLM
jgi:hypothetical protein